MIGGSVSLRVTTLGRFSLLRDQDVLIRQMAGHTVSATFCEEIYKYTEGNPSLLVNVSVH